MWFLSKSKVPGNLTTSCSAERKKRQLSFPAAQNDIDYAVKVLVEAQFRWTPQIESEIKVSIEILMIFYFCALISTKHPLQAEYGLGKDHVNFSRALVREFHDDFRQGKFGQSLETTIVPWPH